MNKLIQNIKDNLKQYIFLMLIVFFVLIELSGTAIKTKKVEVTDRPILASKKEIKKIKVDVKGSVNAPGVYELDENSRVIDAINLAGGVNENADTSNINLSLKLEDEMVIIVYSKEEIEVYKNGNMKTKYVYIEVNKCPDKMNSACINNKNTISKKQNVKSNTNTVSSDSNISENKTININTATSEELKTLTGIGDSKANDIINYRNENGNFNSAEDIKNVSGIGDSLFEKIKESITV